MPQVFRVKYHEDLKMFTRAYDFKINKITRNFIFTKINLFIETNIQYFAGYPISIIR